MQKVKILISSKTPGSPARYLLVALLWLLGTAVIATTGGAAADLQQRKLDAIVKEFRERLGIPAPVLVSLVEANRYLVSVERVTEPEAGFLIQFDRNFLVTLSEEELHAVIAHELGHIWIFTHHPYLQTEPLANAKALQVVSRESLAQVYQKVWQFQGHGTPEDFLAKME